jgi:hypothetical protein
MGSILSGAGTIATGQMAATAKAWNAAQDSQDEQKALSYSALSAQDKGRLDAGKIRMAGSQLVAKQKVAYANSGVAIDSGTPAAVMESTQGLSELDAQTAENNAAREVWGYRMQQEQSKKNMQRKIDEANREAIGSALTGAGQIVGGAGNLSGGGGGGG